MPYLDDNFQPIVYRVADKSQEQNGAGGLQVNQFSSIPN